MRILVFSAIVLTIGCGDSSSSRRSPTDTGPEAGSGGEVVSIGGSEVGGGGETNGTGGVTVGSGGTGTGGVAGSPATGGQAGSVDATGGSGNVGGNCQPWDCTNIAIDLVGWDSTSGEPVPEACGLVQDPCTGMMVDCGGCNNDPLQGCERGEMIAEGSFFENEGTPNICGGNCLFVGTVSCDQSGSDTMVEMICTLDDQPWRENCVPTNSRNRWCCPA
jgi:hypothetical protein